MDKCPNGHLTPFASGVLKSVHMVENVSSQKEFTGVATVGLCASLAANFHGHYLSVSKTRAEKLQTSRNFSDMKRASSESCC